LHCGKDEKEIDYYSLITFNFKKKKGENDFYHMTYYDDDTCCFGLKCPKYVATEHKEHKEPEKPKPKPEEAAPAEDICKDNSCMGPGACLLFDKEGKV